MLNKDQQIVEMALVIAPFVSTNCIPCSVVSDCNRQVSHPCEHQLGIAQEQANALWEAGYRKVELEKLTLLDESNITIIHNTQARIDKCLHGRTLTISVHPLLKAQLAHTKRELKREIGG